MGNLEKIPLTAAISNLSSAVLYPSVCFISSMASFFPGVRYQRLFYLFLETLNLLFVKSFENFTCQLNSVIKIGIS